MTRRRSSPSRYDRGGRANTPGQKALDDTAEARIGRQIEAQPNGCWFFTGPLTNGYGRTRDGKGRCGNLVQVHRFVYETLIGPIPDGHHLHHECGETRCCNPAHLTPLSPAEHKAAHR